MTLSFTFTPSLGRIAFGPGMRGELGAWIDKLGCKRAFVLSTPQQEAAARHLAASIDARPPGFSPAPRCTRRSR